MSILDSLNALNLGPDVIVELSYEDGCDCFMHTDDAVETAMSETDVIDRLADLVATPGLEVATQYGNDILESLRDECLLDDYERDGTFADFLSSTFRDNFFDLDIVESTVEAYDYKRGFCTLSAVCSAPIGQVLETSPDLAGWKVEVPVHGGRLAFEG